ncbi:hypothetical protein, partial [Vibrio ordalii]|uniref:hypothetical protein n=1 Tax=Vibrio ordalii TaxID=28174 RepID=UPI003F67ECCF
FHLHRPLTRLTEIRYLTHSSDMMPSPKVTTIWIYYAWLFNTVFYLLTMQETFMARLILSCG